MQIKINFTDFWPGFDPLDNFIMSALKGRLEVVIDREPDFLFYSCFGMKHLDFDCVRIFYTGENIQPDFNLCDYAIGFSYGSWGDRYLRYPLYQMLDPELTMARRKHSFESAEAMLRRRFCNFVYSNGSADQNRRMFFEELSRHRKVDSGGGYLNNLGHRVENKLQFQQQYKFSIAFENASAPGYTTEKIVQAFAAGTVPIYWGNPLVGQEFNTNSFINCHEYDSFEDVIKVVLEMDRDDDKYLQMLRAPVDEGIVWDMDLAEEALKKFLCAIMQQPKAAAYRRTRAAAALNYENTMMHLRRLAENPVVRVLVRARNWYQRHREKKGGMKP